MICCLVIHLTFILFLALITAPIPDTVAAVLRQLSGTPVRWVVVLPNALLCPSDASKCKERKKIRLIYLHKPCIQFMGQQPEK